MSYISPRNCIEIVIYALAREDLHYATLNISNSESLTLKKFVDVGNQAINIGTNNVTEEETYDVFDVIGVLKNTNIYFDI